MVLSYFSARSTELKNHIERKITFFYQMKEKTERKIVLKEVDADGMILVMEYIYTARITVNKNNAMQLLTISDYLQIDGMIC